ncbi:MAG: hypothetical protein C0591_14360 [Marinilabiliales bacterium]|nr:MAG: hypothetical protein C0591_14360 [Marinilabiliales bacterium]
MIMDWLKDFLFRTDTQFILRIRKVIFFTIIILLFSCNKRQKISPHEQFRGLWKLYIIEYQDSSGVWQEHAWNKGGNSYILYDGLGHMAVQITPERYKDIKVNFPKSNIDSLSIEELKADLRTYAANYVYTANCVILDEEEIIEHHRLSHTYPYDWGVIAQRRFEFKADTLILLPVEPQNPIRLKWIKQH